MTEKVLGKISCAEYGIGGYDDVQFGLSITLSLDGGSQGIQDFKGNWQTYPEHAKYSLEDWQNGHLQAALFLLQLLKEAKKMHVGQLVGVPVEAEIDSNTLKSWRVLTEVL